jgi:hypothetical protein
MPSCVSSSRPGRRARAQAAGVEKLLAGARGAKRRAVRVSNDVGYLTLTLILVLLGCRAPAAVAERPTPPPKPPPAPLPVVPAPSPVTPPAATLPAFAQVEAAQPLDATFLVSAGGELVAVRSSLSDGARASYNVFFSLIDPDSGEAIRTSWIHPPEAMVEPRLESGRAHAAWLLGQVQWTELSAYAMEEDPVQTQAWRDKPHLPPRALARGEGLVIRYEEPVVTVSSESGATLLTRRVPGWSDVADPGCDPPESCHSCAAAPASLAQVHGSRALRVLLFTVRYHGYGDVCWERDESFHAIRLP